MDILEQKLIIRDKTINSLKIELEEVNKLNLLLEEKLNEQTKTIKKLTKVPKKRGPKKQSGLEDGSFKNSMTPLDGSFQEKPDEPDEPDEPISPDIGEFNHIESEILMNVDKQFDKDYINNIIETYNGSIHSTFTYHKQQHILKDEHYVKLINYSNQYETNETNGNDFKLTITPETLIELVGDTIVNKLLTLYNGYYNTIYIRKVTGNNSLIDFHKDYSKQTMKIALNDHSEYIGGDLVYLSDGLIHKPEQVKGSITIHTNDIIHGVTPIISGVRYSLFILHTPPM